MAPSQWRRGPFCVWGNMLRLLLLSLLCCWTTYLLHAQPPAPAPLQLTVSNIQEASGNLWVGIYTSDEDWLDREKARLEYFPVTRKGELTVSITGLEAGEDYAFAIFQDVDGDHELNTNFLGIPAEPWALSGKLRSVFRKPYFEEMAFVFRPGQGLRLELR